MKRLSSRDYAKLLLTTVSDVSATQRSATVKRFLALLRRQRALKLLPRIVDHLQLLDDQRQERTRVTLTTAAPIDLHQLTKRLESVVGRVVVDVRTQPELLGGVTLRIADTELDGSVRTQLARLRTHLSHT
ncbi:MAG: F0F1 ATP synthase subunit delta [Candidatus Kerfeldbacteria bacterium]|nr:F0F1 ATP synthase subunit delta [Candidatus Kerfeldbacteria bacterium]